MGLCTLPSSRGCCCCCCCCCSCGSFPSAASTRSAHPQFLPRKRILTVRRQSPGNFTARRLQSSWITASPLPLAKRVSSHDVDGYAESEKCREANLLAQRKDRIKLPDYANELGRDYSISEFLNDPSGVEAVLNVKAFQSFETLDSRTYRCSLHKIKFMSFEVIPVIDVQVTHTNDGCKIEMLSCKFGGSEIFKQQNHRFSAFMRNLITWEENISEPCLVFDVCLRVTLQVFTKPFTLLPLSAVENPGNLILQGLVDRLVSFLSEQLLQDYERWVTDRSKSNCREP